MRVKVYNDHEFTHKEEFKGDMIIIKPGEFIEMEEDEAVQFRGQFYPPAVDGDGNMIPQRLDQYGKPLIGQGGYKKIRIASTGEVAKPESDAEAKMALKCQACGFQACSKWELDGHIADLHLDAMEDDDARKELKAKKDGKKPYKPGDNLKKARAAKAAKIEAERKQAENAANGVLE